MIRFDAQTALLGQVDAAAHDLHRLLGQPLATFLPDPVGVDAVHSAGDGGGDLLAAGNLAHALHTVGVGEDDDISGKIGRVCAGQIQLPMQSCPATGKTSAFTMVGMLLMGFLSFTVDPLRSLSCGSPLLRFPQGLAGWAGRERPPAVPAAPPYPSRPPGSWQDPWQGGRDSA